MITRRVFQRTFLLRPSAAINEIFNYCLAGAAKRYNIGLVAWTAMSNHYHAVVHDPDGKLPAFLEQFHKMLAKTLNSHYGRWENLWSTEETCATRLVTAEDIFDKVVYVLLNPVAAHLVDSAVQWPGASSWNYMGRKGTTEARPRAYFRKDGSKMPAKARLEAVAPPGLDEAAYAAWIDKVREAVRAGEVDAKKTRIEKSIPLVGRKTVLTTDPYGTPRTEAPRRRLRPSLACKDRRRMTEERIALMTFRFEHMEARLQFVAGRHEVVFPAGTYRMLAWGARCAPFPTTSAA